MVNDILGTISFTHLFSTRQLYSSTSLYISDISVTKQSFSSLEILFGEEFGLASAALSSAASSYTFSSDDTSKIVTLTKIVNSVNDFSVSGILSPTFTPSTGIKIKTISANGFEMDKSASIYWTTKCTLPCR